MDTRRRIEIWMKDDKKHKSWEMKEERRKIRDIRWMNEWMIRDKRSELNIKLKDKMLSWMMNDERINDKQ